MSCCNRIWSAFSRRRVIESSDQKENLARVLNLFDLVSLGVGATIGVGTFVIIGQIAKETAGPAVCISFIIAGVASVFSGQYINQFKLFN